MDELNLTYFAEIDQTDTVIRVIVADQGFIDRGVVGNPSNWIECFYDEDGKVNSKKTFPGPGYKYDYNAGLFYMPQPYPSWTLDSNFDWNPPTPMPEEVDNTWIWDESAQEWIVGANSAGYNGQPAGPQGPGNENT